MVLPSSREQFCCSYLLLPTVLTACFSLLTRSSSMLQLSLTRPPLHMGTRTGEACCRRVSRSNFLELERFRPGWIFGALRSRAAGLLWTLTAVATSPLDWPH